MSDTEKIADLALTDDTNTGKLIDFSRGENSSSQLRQMPDSFSGWGGKHAQRAGRAQGFSARCFLCFIFIFTLKKTPNFI